MRWLVADSLFRRYARKAGGGLAVSLGLLLAAPQASADAWLPPSASSHANPETAPSPASEWLPRQAVKTEPSDEDPHYAKICDAFGEGFVYSASTGACIKIGGSVKFGASFGRRN
jgi:hypothetical protein